MIPLCRQVWNPTLRLNSTSLASIAYRSRYATKTATKTPSVRPVIRALPSRVSIPSQERLGPTALRQQYKTDQAYERGVRNIYTAPSHIGILSFSWALGTFLITYATWLGIEGNWNMGDRMAGGQKMLVETGNRLGMICFTAIGAFTLVRYTGLVKSIDLVHKGGRAKLCLRVRRFVPFIKPTEIVLPARDLSLPPYWRHQVDDLSLGSGDLRRRGFNFNPGKLFWVTFVKFRAWVFKHGIIDITYNGDKTVCLDLSGDFSNRGGDLWELTTTTKSNMPFG